MTNRRFRTTSAHSRGAVLLESAITLPILLVLAVVTVEISQIISHKMMLGTIAAEAARAAAATPELKVGDRDDFIDLYHPYVNDPSQAAIEAITPNGAIDSPTVCAARPGEAAYNPAVQPYCAHVLLQLKVYQLLNSYQSRFINDAVDPVEVRTWLSDPANAADPDSRDTASVAITVTYRSLLPIFDGIRLSYESSVPYLWDEWLS